ncbi:probable 18S rRNA (guanine-N(7))-methyltransferase [Hyalella azteca]|uniref:Probable 18S rRNA (Guanine-N(7))-methyltransferase n=1 Tax=Hyalella azteca TaxID=294128 RepID=A0A979FH07_HYAAZ|nr:probable 18S rRNA (guanine-N(7))-methyltransferase [Hyalella azteca]
MGKMTARRPEHQSPPDIFYNEEEAQKYTRNTRIMDVQSQCSVRALELLALPPDQPSILLDLGCGSGLSGEAITEQGHFWVGLDISQAMLDVALERSAEGDMLLSDLGHGVPFRPAMFDGAAQNSACRASAEEARTAAVRQHREQQRQADEQQRRRLLALWERQQTLVENRKREREQAARKSRGSRAVFQFYPESDQQVSLIVKQATKAGFTGGVVVDYPNSTKAKKLYLVLMCGGSAPLPQGLQDEGVPEAAYNRRLQLKKGVRTTAAIREKIRQKKERRMKQGKQVHRDSKYTGRPRSSRF